MRPFEEQLRTALRRCEPGKDFTDRVLAKVDEQTRYPAKREFGRWFKLLVPVTAAFLVMTGGTAYEAHERAVRGREAKEQVMLAVQIAGSELHAARERVIGIDRDRETKQ